MLHFMKTTIAFISFLAVLSACTTGNKPVAENDPMDTLPHAAPSMACW